MKASELYTLAIEDYKQVVRICNMTLRDYCKERHICYNGIQHWMSRHSIKVAELKPVLAQSQSSVSTSDEPHLYPLTFAKDVSEKPILTGNLFPMIKGVNITFPDGVIISIKEIRQEDLNKFILTYSNS